MNEEKLSDDKERAPVAGNIDWPDYEPMPSEEEEFTETMNRVLTRLQDADSRAAEVRRKRFDKLRDMIDPDHDLDGTALPSGHEQYTAQQERFDLLWNKCLNRTATPEEIAEMYEMQMDYWSK